MTHLRLNDLTHNRGLNQHFSLNITLILSAISCCNIALFAWIADRFDQQKMCIIGGLIGAVLLTKIAHDRVFINPFSLHRLVLNTDTAVQWQ